MPTKTESPPVKNRDAKELEFQGLNGKKVSIVFDEPELTSDAGLLAIGEFEKSLGWIEKLAGCISDGRVDPTHGMKKLLTQRIYQIMGGYPDANDCDRMRSDGTLQTISGVDAATGEPADDVAAGKHGEGHRSKPGFRTSFDWCCNCIFREWQPGGCIVAVKSKHYFSTRNFGDLLSESSGEFGTRRTMAV